MRCVMAAPEKPGKAGFWQIYGVVMAIDLLLYILIFYVGKAIPAAPGTSAPGNMNLVVAWLFVHVPAALIFFTTRALSESLMWLLILQDVWLASLVHLWRRRRAPNSALQ
jgi:Na+-driven multidrug efflux pump